MYAYFDVSLENCGSLGYVQHANRVFIHPLLLAVAFDEVLIFQSLWVKNLRRYEKTVATYSIRVDPNSLVLRLKVSYKAFIRGF